MPIPLMTRIGGMLSVIAVLGAASLEAAAALPIETAGVRDPSLVATTPVAYRKHRRFRNMTPAQQERRMNKRYDCEQFSSRPRCLNAGPMTPG